MQAVLSYFKKNDNITVLHNTPRIGHSMEREIQELCLENRQKSRDKILLEYKKILTTKGFDYNTISKNELIYNNAKNSQIMQDAIKDILNNQSTYERYCNLIALKSFVKKNQDWFNHNIDHSIIETNFIGDHRDYDDSSITSPESSNTLSC